MAPEKSIPESEQHDRLRGRLAELYYAVIRTTTPTDQFVEGFFRTRPQIAMKGRMFLAAALYSLLRRRPQLLMLREWAERQSGAPSLMEAIAGTHPLEEAALATYLWLAKDLGAESRKAEALTLTAMDHAAEQGVATKEELDALSATVGDFARRVAKDPALSHAPRAIQLAAEFSIAPELLQRWTAERGEAAAVALAKAFHQPAPLDVRVNRHRKSREDVLQHMREHRLEVSPGAYSDDCIRFVKKASLKDLPAMKEGWCEIHEQASQLVSLAVAPEPGWKILDACAGAGGKTIHLASLMGGKGVVYAHDTDPARLKPLEQRIPRNQLTNVRIAWPGTAAMFAPYDAVLIDAPCLGLGRLRREPTLQWRGPMDARIAETTAQQRECLALYAPLVKPGGILVYATCSFEPEETTGMMAELQRSFPDFAPDWLPFQNEKIRASQSADRSSLTMLPSTHNTDGFFIARMRRKEK